MGEEQNSFRKDVREEDNMLVVMEVIEKIMREKSKGYFAFLDIEKAYDGINRYKLSKILKRVGMKIIMSMYEGTKAKYSIRNLESGWVRNGRGVPQGSVLSPLLFGLYT